MIKEATAHYMGMTATVINGLALQDALEGEGCATRLLTTIRMDEVAEPFIRRPRPVAPGESGREGRGRGKWAGECGSRPRGASSPGFGLGKKPATQIE